MSEDLDLPGHPRVREDAVFRPLGGEWVVYDPEGRRLHVMNLTAALVWSFCDGSRNRAEIVGEVRDAFPEPPDPDRVEEDVDEALETFRAKGLLQGPEGSDPPKSGREPERDPGSGWEEA